MQPEEHPELKMTHMEEDMLHVAELISGLMKTGLSENAAVRFAAIWYSEQSSKADD